MPSEKAKKVAELVKEIHEREAQLEALMGAGPKRGRPSLQVVEPKTSEGGGPN